MSHDPRAYRQGLEARVLSRKAGLYPQLRGDVWYHVRPDGPDENGWCWLAAYGVKQRVAITDFEFRPAR